MKKYLLLPLVLLSSALFSLEPNDNHEIVQIIYGLENSWNQNSGHGFADYYTQDADFVNVLGMVFHSREEIEERHVKILETILKGSKYETLAYSIREVKPDVVVAHVHWQVSNIPKPIRAPFKETIKGVFTHVLVKTNDHWEIIATQNTLAQ